MDLPVYLENNAVALALTEYNVNSKPPFKNTMFVVIADGIGAAILQDGKVFRGLQGYAGELGHISIDINGMPCSCGNRGCLELYATMTALKSRYGFDDYKKVADDAAAGERYACEIMDDLTACLTGSLVNAVNLFDLDTVVLYGEYAYRGDRLAKILEDKVNRQSLICKAHHVAVYPSCLTPKDAETAAAAPVLDAFFDQILQKPL